MGSLMFRNPSTNSHQNHPRDREWRTDGIPTGVKVYISCHPSDEASLLDQICSEVWQSGGEQCTLFHLFNRDETTGDLLAGSHLDEMSLIVMVVTRKYLEQRGQTFLDLLGLANAQHIRLLPIVMEGVSDGEAAAFFDGLENQWSGISKIQRLTHAEHVPISAGEHERLTHDETSPDGYEASLRKVLEEVSLTSEMAESIHREFGDRRLFLSYRRLDRRSAIELMKRIHSIEGYWDVSIWYDSLLEGGTVWPSEIEAQIEDSRAVLLAITEHVLDKAPSETVSHGQAPADNYVVGKEYPLAREKYHKRVIPIVLADIDDRELSKSFAGLSDRVDGNDIRALAEALSDVIPPASDYSQEHVWPIAQAYLRGIGVEKDPGMAVRLLLSAKKEESDDAVDIYEELARIYCSGDGVNKDSREGLKYQRQAVRLRGDEQDSHPSKAGYIRLGESRRQLSWLTWNAAGDMLSALDFRVAEEMYKEALDIVVSLARKYGDDCYYADVFGGFGFAIGWEGDILDSYNIHYILRWNYQMGKLFQDALGWVRPERLYLLNDFCDQAIMFLEVSLQDLVPAIYEDKDIPHFQKIYERYNNDEDLLLKTGVVPKNFNEYFRDEKFQFFLRCKHVLNECVRYWRNRQIELTDLIDKKILDGTLFFHGPEGLESYCNDKIDSRLRYLRELKEESWNANRLRLINEYISRFSGDKEKILQLTKDYPHC